MSGPIRAALLLLLASPTSVAGCADPNPTFVFDAAPAVKDASGAGSTAGSGGGSGGSGGSGGNGGGGGSDSGDAGVEAAGGSP